MNKFLLIILLFLICEVCTSQNDSLRAYYATVALAEKQVCENNFSQAALSYKKAFTYKVSPFYVDVYNALQCEMKNTPIDDSVCIKYAILLLKKGLYRDDDTFWWTRFLKSIPVEKHKIMEVLLPFYSLKYNDKNRIIDTMFENDQRIRTNGIDKNNISLLDSIDNINKIKLLELLKNIDYLNEDVVGNKYITTNIKVMLIHQYGYNKNVEFDVNECLLNAVKNGVLDARFYASLYDRWYENNVTFVYEEGYFGTSLLQLFCDSITFGHDVCEKYVAYLNFNRNDTADINNIAKINFHRADIYLGDVINESYRRFDLTMNYVFFISPMSLSLRADPNNTVTKNISNLLNKGFDIDYYIQDERDFDRKMLESK